MELSLTLTPRRAGDWPTTPGRARRARAAVPGARWPPHGAGRGGTRREAAPRWSGAAGAGGPAAAAPPRPGPSGVRSPRWPHWRRRPQRPPASPARRRDRGGTRGARPRGGRQLLFALTPPPPASRPAPGFLVQTSCRGAAEPPPSCPRPAPRAPPRLRAPQSGWGAARGTLRVLLRASLVPTPGRRRARSPGR